MPGSKLRLMPERLLLRGLPRLLLLWGCPSHGRLLLRLLEELILLLLAVDKIEAVDLEFMAGVLWDVLHVPFQQAHKIVYDLLLADVGVAGPKEPALERI